MYSTRNGYLLHIIGLFMVIFLILPRAFAQQETIDLEKEPWREPIPKGLYIKPYLQNVTQQSIVVMWETKEPLIGHVDYGQTKSFGNTISETTPVTIHEVKVPELDPGTTYHYRVRYGDMTLEPSTFKTAPPDGVENCQIIVYGDARSNPKQHRKNVEQMLKFNPDIILHTGDIVARGRTYHQWQQQHFWPIQIIAGKVPSFAALGNHEQNSSHHFNYMSLPGNEVYFSFDYANVHIISLDSNSGATPYAPGTPQYDWLVKDLEANQDAQWIFVMFHHPLFRCHPTRGIERQRYDWHPVFEKYGVDFVLSGHDHYYFRSYPIGKLGLGPSQGVRYLTTAGGGASLYPVRDRIYGAVSNSIHHITVLDIQGSRIEGRAIDSDGNTFDHFTLTKTPAPPDQYIAYELFEIERELRSQLNQMKPIVVEKSGDSIVVDTTLSVSTNFDIRVEGDIVWEDSEQWKFSSKTTPFVVNPGATLRIPIKAEATYPDIYPIPKMTIHFSKPINREEGFRNDKLTFQPIKVQPLLPVKVRRIYSTVDVDGKLNDPAWTATTRLQNFVTAQGDIPQMSLFPLQLEFQSALDNGSISEDLRRAFEANGISFSQNVTLSIRESGSQWLITDRDKKQEYIIRKKGEALNTYVPTNKLSAMLAHDGQYLYAAAQIEGDSQLVGELLFSVDLTDQSDLNNLSISNSLKRAFENNAIPLSQETTVSITKEGSQWLITDNEMKKRYAVRKVEGKLNIFREEGYTDYDNRRILDRDENFVLTLLSESEPLSSVDLVFQSDLDNQSLSDNLQRAFKMTGISLSQDATISIEKKGNRWLITDGRNKQTYTVRKKQEQLNVHRTNIYIFGVNARNTKVDQNNADWGWNLDWVSRTVATESGWAVEMAIPIVAFGNNLHEKQWRIGISRMNDTNSEVVALTPSFTATSRENTLPEYSYSHTDISSLSPLTLENLIPASKEVDN